MEPGTIYPLTIKLYPDIERVQDAAIGFGVDVSSSNFPRFDVNPNTGEPLTTIAAQRGHQHGVSRRGPSLAHRAARGAAKA